MTAKKYNVSGVWRTGIPQRMRHKMGFNSYDKDPPPKLSRGTNIIVRSADADALAKRFETEQYAVGMAFSYAETVAAARALRAYASALASQERRT